MIQKQSPRLAIYFFFLQKKKSSTYIFFFVFPADATAFNRLVLVTEGDKSFLKPFSIAQAMREVAAAQDQLEYTDRAQEYEARIAQLTADLRLMEQQRTNDGQEIEKLRRRVEDLVNEVESVRAALDEEEENRYAPLEGFHERPGRELPELRRLWLEREGLIECHCGNIWDGNAQCDCCVMGGCEYADQDEDECEVFVLEECDKCNNTHPRDMECGEIPRRTLAQEIMEEEESSSSDEFFFASSPQRDAPAYEPRGYFGRPASPEPMSYDQRLLKEYELELDSREARIQRLQADLEKAQDLADERQQAQDVPLEDIDLDEGNEALFWEDHQREVDFLSGTIMDLQEENESLKRDLHQARGEIANYERLEEERELERIRPMRRRRRYAPRRLQKEREQLDGITEIKRKRRSRAPGFGETPSDEFKAMWNKAETLNKRRKNKKIFEIDEEELSEEF